MKIKTKDLTGVALDWAVGMAEGYELNLYGVDPSIRARVPGLGVHAPWRPSRYWAQGGPIIERERINVYEDIHPTSTWGATIYEVDAEPWQEYGPTPLIAALRAYVASNFGDEIELPDELHPGAPV